MKTPIRAFLIGAMMVGTVCAALAQSPGPAVGQDNPRCAAKAQEWDSLRAQDSPAQAMRSFANDLPAYCPNLAARVLAAAEESERAANAKRQRVAQEGQDLRNEIALLRGELSRARSDRSAAESRASALQSQLDKANAELKATKPIALRPVRDLGADVVAAIAAQNWSKIGSIAFEYDQGAGGRKADRDAAARLFQLACDAGANYHCGNIALFYRSGSIVPRSDALALSYGRIGCDAGNAPGCKVVGDSYRHGWGVTANTEEAIRQYRRAVAANPNYSHATSALKALGVQ